LEVIDVKAWGPRSLFKLCTNKNHSYKHNEQINNKNIDNSECFGVKFVKIYPEMNRHGRKEVFVNLLVRKIIYDYMYPVDLEKNERSCEYSANSF
jgi:hypothetical protein